jgi:hypothetical protein
MTACAGGELAPSRGSAKNPTTHTSAATEQNPNESERRVQFYAA